MTLFGILSGDLRWTICGGVNEMHVWWCGDSHPDFAVIACRSEHTRIRWVPCHGVAAAFLVTFKLLDESSIVFVPDVHSTSYFQVSK